MRGEEVGKGRRRKDDFLFFITLFDEALVVERPDAPQRHV